MVLLSTDPVEIDLLKAGNWVAVFNKKFFWVGVLPGVLGLRVGLGSIGGPDLRVLVFSFPHVEPFGDEGKGFAESAFFRDSHQNLSSEQERAPARYKANAKAAIV